jgi:hypothetical protein
MKTLRYGDKLLIFDSREPLKYVDLRTKRFYVFPIVAEASEWPVYKWYRNPINWYRWHKVLRISKRNTKVILQTTPRENDESL